MGSKSTNTNAANVRTPGEDPAPESGASAGDPTAQTGAGGGEGAQGPTTSEVLKAAEEVKIPGAKMTMEQRFAAMEAEMKRLSTENAHLLATQAALVNIAGTAATSAPTVKLPKASEFTPEVQREMKSAVLTESGWIVPAHLGSSPVLHELQKLGLSATA